MTNTRMLLETGIGTDLQGKDFTKAAIRAVKNAMAQNSLLLFKSLELDKENMHIRITLGVTKPKKVDVELVKKCLPHGIVSIITVPGGAYIESNDNLPSSLVVCAGVEVFCNFQSLGQHSN